MSKPRILFFARGYQADFYPALVDDSYDAVFVTLTRGEKARVEANGRTVAACFEEDFDSLQPAAVPDNYLGKSYMADRFLGRFDHVRRREILGKEIAFWSQLLDRNRPAAVVNELVAIEISEVLLIESRRRDIRYLAPMNCPVEGYFYWMPNPLSLSARYLDPVTAGDRARGLAKAYATEVLQKNYRPFYVRNLARRRAWRPLGAAALKYLFWQLREIGRGNSFRYEDYREEYGKRLAVYLRSLTTRYDRLEDIDPQTELIFYPLHQEPEATLNYMSEFHANQVSTIENLMKCLGPQQALVVKEHPVDKGALLRSKFLDLKRRYSSLYFLPAEIHGRQVLDRASRVVTLTSSVGWEAAAAGRSVYVLGEIFFDQLPGITRIESFGQLRAELRKPPRDETELTPEIFEKFVAGMVERSQPGNPFQHHGLFSPENVAHVVAAIRRAASL
ncbi:MAG: hypothetical protein V4618_04815 [Pseudomonadota bacterium]